MDYDTVPKFAIVISVVAVLFAAVAIVLVATDDRPDDRYRIYIGLDGDASYETEDAIESYMKGLLMEEYGTGYTMYWADGAYVDGDTVFENRTLVIVLLDMGASDARTVADAALGQDGVSSVSIETYGSDFTVVTN